jgi:hypothetical protein
VTSALLGLILLSAATLLLGWAYFRRFQVTRPPIGVMTLGDVVVLIIGIVLIPYLYLVLPAWLVGAILPLGSLSILQLLCEPIVLGRRLSWLIAVGLVASDVVLAWSTGTTSLAFFAVNDLIIVLLVVGVTNLWAQSGLKARDLAILAAALTLYDLVATGVLPLTGDLIARLAGLPFTPLLAWPLGDGRWAGIGLGDLLLATVAPLVFRKAFGRTAGLVAMIISLAAVGGVLVFVMTGKAQATFPVMVVLGPLLLAQYFALRHANGGERTTADYLRAEPLAAQHCRHGSVATRNDPRGALSPAPVSDR